MVKGVGKPVIGYSFTWKPEKKDANDFSQGQLQDERQKLFNIQHNGELTEQEKWRAIDKVKGLTLGSTEKQALADKQAEHDKKNKRIKQDKKHLLNSERGLEIMPKTIRELC